MANAGMPNPIELYEGARDYMVPIIGGVKPSQLTDSTPCSEWNVQQLINHNLKVTQFVQNILTGGPPIDDTAVSDPLPEEGTQEAFVAGTDQVLALIKASGMLEKVVSTPFGDMPAGNFLMFPFGDILIHKWEPSPGHWPGHHGGRRHGASSLPGLGSGVGWDAGHSFWTGSTYANQRQRPRQASGIDRAHSLNQTTPAT